MAVNTERAGWTPLVREAVDSEDSGSTGCSGSDRPHACRAARATPDARHRRVGGARTLDGRRPRTARVPPGAVASRGCLRRRRKYASWYNQGRSRPGAGVAKLADALDSKSSEAHPSCGFDSHLRHTKPLHPRVRRPPTDLAAPRRALLLLGTASSRVGEVFGSWASRFSSPGRMRLRGGATSTPSPGNGSPPADSSSTALSRSREGRRSVASRRRRRNGLSPGRRPRAAGRAGPRTSR